MAIRNKTLNDIEELFENGKKTEAGSGLRDTSSALGYPQTRTPAWGKHIAQERWGCRDVVKRIANLGIWKPPKRPKSLRESTRGTGEGTGTAPQRLRASSNSQHGGSPDTRCPLRMHSTSGTQPQSDSPVVAALDLNIEKLQLRHGLGKELIHLSRP